MTQVMDGDANWSVRPDMLFSATPASQLLVPLYEE
jgi:hypothetical protein